MKIKAIQNFGHAPSRRAFEIGKIYEVTEASAHEFVAGKLAVFVPADKPEEPKAKKSKGE